MLGWKITKRPQRNSIFWKIQCQMYPACISKLEISPRQVPTTVQIFYSIFLLCSLYFFSTFLVYKYNLAIHFLNLNSVLVPPNITKYAVKSFYAKVFLLSHLELMNESLSDPLPIFPNLTFLFKLVSIFN